MNQGTGRALYAHLYKTAAWQRLRAWQLNREPMCRYCSRMGRDELASVADHIIPHRGDRSLFFDGNNLQSLCKHCHDSVKQQQESTGTLRGCDANGVPIDSSHHWNK